MVSCFNIIFERDILCFESDGHGQISNGICHMNDIDIFLLLLINIRHRPLILAAAPLIVWKSGWISGM